MSIMMGRLPACPNMMDLDETMLITLMTRTKWPFSVNSDSEIQDEMIHPFHSSIKSVGEWWEVMHIFWIFDRSRFALLEYRFFVNRTFSNPSFLATNQRGLCPHYSASAQNQSDSWVHSIRLGMIRLQYNRCILSLFLFLLCGMPWDCVSPRFFTVSLSEKWIQNADHNLCTEFDGDGRINLPD